MIKRLFLLLGLLSIAAAPAQLSIDKNLTAYPDSVVFTITSGNSSFGTKATAAPIKFDNFEDGADGNTLQSNGYWTEYLSSNLRVFFMFLDK